jgi:hypothetical protein
MTKTCTKLNPQQPAQHQHHQQQLPPEFLQPKYWFSQLVERTYTDDETGNTYRSIGVVVGLTLNLPGWSVPGWVYFIKFLWSDGAIPQLPFVDEVSESDLHPVFFS